MEKKGDRFLYLHAALLLAAVFCLSLTRVIGLDIWWHLGVGRYLLQARSFPSHDVFSFTAPYWDNKEWLFGIFVYIVQRAGGLDGLSFAKAFLFTATFFTLFVLCLRRSRNHYLSIGFVVLAALACRMRLAFRPELFSYLFMAVLLLMLDSFQGGRRKPLCLFPLLMLLWVNLHPQAFVGLLILAVYIAGDLIARLLPGPARRNAWRRLTGRDFILLVLIFLVSCVAFTCNPISLHRFLSPVELMTTHSKYLSSLTEAATMSVEEIITVNPWFIALSLVAVFVLVMFVSIMEPTDSLIVIAGLLVWFPAFRMSRNLPYPCLLWVPVFACQLARIVSRIPADAASFLAASRKFFDAVLSIALVCVIVWALFLPNFGVGFSEVLFPEGAIEYVKANGPSGEMFNIYDWGGFLIWNLYPRYRVFIDGRGPDAYPPWLWADYQTVQGGEDGWEEVLDRYGVNFVLLATGNKLHDLIDEMNGAGEWRLVYWDEVRGRGGIPVHPLAMVFVRDVPENRPLIDAYTYRLFDPSGPSFRPWSPPFELQAMGELRNYLKENPASLEARSLLAMTCMGKGLVDPAIEEYEAITAAHPGIPTLHYNLGMLYSRKGNEEKAREEYEKEILSNRKFPPAYNNLGRILYTRGDLAGAERNFKKALKYEPKYVPALNNLGIIRMERGEYEKAASDFRRVLELEPGYEQAAMNLSLTDKMLARPAETNNELGEMYFEMGEYDRAEEQFLRALKHDPGLAAAVNNLGVLDMKRGRYEEAILDFRRALEIDPVCPGARENMAAAGSMLQEGPVLEVTQ